jgi:CRISP-associated protein Cas1
MQEAAPMDRIVDIATDGLHLSAHRGFLIVSLDRAEQGRVALDDVHALIIHAHGVTWTTNLVVTLAERGAIMVLCGSNHAPVAVMTPIDGHYAQGGRMRAQWASGEPLRKQLWRHVVIAKINMQASLLASLGAPEADALSFLSKRVRSGDPDNLEAQAARRYWPVLMGVDFRRDRDADGANALLNYGYAVMRATVARAVIGAGLHPSIGLHHKSGVNSFALADDLVEPFRPLVDAVVRRMVGEGVDAVTPESKKPLAHLIGADLRLDDALSPVSVAAQRLAGSLAKSFESGKPELSLFDPPDPLAWAGIGNAANAD